MHDRCIQNVLRRVYIDILSVWISALGALDRLRKISDGRGRSVGEQCASHSGAGLRPVHVLGWGWMSPTNLGKS